MSIYKLFPLPPPFKHTKPLYCLASVLSASNAKPVEGIISMYEAKSNLRFQVGAVRIFIIEKKFLVFMNTALAKEHPLRMYEITSQMKNELKESLLELQEAAKHSEELGKIIDVNAEISDYVQRRIDFVVAHQVSAVEQYAFEELSIYEGIQINEVKPGSTLDQLFEIDINPTRIFGTGIDAVYRPVKRKLPNTRPYILVPYIRDLY